jgi:hypothetical protein
MDGEKRGAGEMKALAGRFTETLQDVKKASEASGIIKQSEPQSGFFRAERAVFVFENIQMLSPSTKPAGDFETATEILYKDGTHVTFNSPEADAERFADEFSAYLSAVQGPLTEI